MMRLLPLVLVLLILPSFASGWVSQQGDWLVSTSPPKPTAVDASVPGRLTLGNGLLARSFALAPCFGTVELMRTDVQQTFLRGMSPEAVVSINGTTFNVGGCVSAQSNPQQFDPSKPLTQDPLAWSFVSYSTSAPVAAYPWSPSQRYAPSTAVWPPRGLHLAVTFRPPAIIPDPASQTFTTLPSFHLACPASGPCLTGWPTCDNQSVPGQCSWPVATAQASCAAWVACEGVNCATGRSDCQARGAGSVLSAGAGATAIIRASSAAGALAGTTVVVNYEMYDGVPLLRKWLSVAVAASASAPAVFDTGTIEILRSPNYAPSQVTVIQVQANNPTPFFQQTVPDYARVASAGTTQQLWFTDPLWDAPDDNELHVPYTIYTVLSVGYAFDVAYGGNTGPGAVVLPGQVFDSVSVRTLYHDTSDVERQGLGLRRMAAVLAPSLLESPLHTMITDVSSTAAFRLAIDQAAAVGLDFVIVGYGAAGYCGMCPAQTQNATWVAWFKEQVDYARAKGVGVSAYSLLQSNGWGESVPPEEQIMNRDGSRGGIACFATNWWQDFAASILEFSADVGLMGVETDGEYEFASCSDETHDHHHNGVAGSWDRQLNSTLGFNAALKQRGLYQTGADAYYWSGAQSWNVRAVL
jgi:hypothetical protein